MSKFLEGRVLNFVSDEVYKRLPQDIKETKKIKEKKYIICKFYLSILVPTPGLEPGRLFRQGILSPLRLPIPPSGLIFI